MFTFEHMKAFSWTFPLFQVTPLNPVYLNNRIILATLKNLGFKALLRTY